MLLGYGRTHAELRSTDIHVCGKVVGRRMKEEGLIVKTRKTKKYTSYQGEIRPAAGREVEGNFHSNNPGELLLSDISELAIPAGKVYLSPAADCFDGLLVARQISEYPNADLVKGMQDDVTAALDVTGKPIIHTDAAVIIGGPVG